jgi:hypothetical protein
MVGLYTRDRVASKIIYDSIFGPGTCTDAADGSHITIRFDNICLEMYEGVPKSMAILSATVPDLDRVRNGLRQCYLPVPYREDNGVVFFEDRDGYRWEVVQKATDAPSPSAPSAEIP